MYFDLHVHPAFKSFLSEAHPHQTDTCWTVYNNIMKIIDSQGSATQLWKGQVTLCVTPLYVMERPFTSSFLLEHIAPLLTPLHERALKFPTQSNSYTRLQQQIEHMEGARQNGDMKFEILSSLKDYNAARLNFILAIEGSHALDEHNSTMVENLKDLKSKPYRFLYLTLTHMTQSPVCSHAYGVKMIKKNDEFKPQGNGLTDMGKELIDTAYDESIGGYRMFIDIKHMSLGTRFDFYEYRADKGYDNIPILATHMGCTGISYNPQSIQAQIKRKVNRDRGFVEVKYKRPEGISKRGRFKTRFNPWSINLYDEEIPVILDSGGLIGINLDKRILGSTPVKGEYFDENEFLTLMGMRDPEEAFKQFQIGGEFEGEPSGMDEEIESRINYKKHLRHLANNILHIVKVGGERAWKQLCLGSDFDGLIDPVQCCHNAAELRHLEGELASTLEEMIEVAKDQDPSLEFCEGDLHMRVRDIMFRNAYLFLDKWFV